MYESKEKHSKMFKKRETFQKCIESKSNVFISLFKKIFVEA
jgi:hypothetical protein